MQSRDHHVHREPSLNGRQATILKKCPRRGETLTVSLRKELAQNACKKEKYQGVFVGGGEISGARESRHREKGDKRGSFDYGKVRPCDPKKTELKRNTNDTGIHKRKKRSNCKEALCRHNRYRKIDGRISHSHPSPGTPGGVPRRGEFLKKGSCKKKTVRRRKKQYLPSCSRTNCTLTRKSTTKDLSSLWVNEGTK